MTGRAAGARSLAPLALLILVSACGPLGPIPGGRLRGDVEPAPPSWSGTASVRTAQLETRPDDPHSVNVWTGVVDGRLFIATSLIRGTDVPAERDWVKNVLADPLVRLKVEGRIYELRATRIEDESLAERVRQAMMAKYDVDPDAHADAAWVFQLTPR